MKFQQLRYFVAVYEEKSFSAAANRVNATQSGLSMHVRKLESRYGVSLFERSWAGVEPTEAGHIFYKRAVEVLSATAKAEESLRELSGAISDHIRIGLMPSFTGTILSFTMMRFTSEFPSVRVTIEEAYSATLSNLVSEGALDFAIVPAVDSDLGLESTLMAVDRECLVCAGNSKIADLKQVRLADMSPLKLIVPTAVNVRRGRIEHYLAVNGIEVAELMELDAMMGTLDLVANSDWLSILPSVLSRPDRDGCKRRFIPLIDPSMSVEYMRISNKAQPMGRAAQAFSDVLQEELNTALEFET